jgi:NADH-quinone oxidoreductase subunit N
MFGLAGVPPTVGFWAKVQVIAAVVNVDLTWLAALAVLMSVVGAYYYLRIVKLMYFDEPTETRPVESKIAVRLMLSVNGLAILVLGLYPGMLLRLCEHVLP